MSSLDSELTAMEESHAMDKEKGNLPNALVSAPATFIPPSSPSFLTSLGPNFATDSILESKAISMTSNDCSSAISSPAEASPAKPAQTSTSIFEKTFDQSPATSHITSPSDLLKCSGMSIVNIPESPVWESSLPSTTFGNSELEVDHPPTLTFKGISVTLENNGIWKQFHQLGTEMILSKQGRRMFPYCRYRLSGLDPDRQYSLVLSIAPSDQFKYRWNASKWETSGTSEHQFEGLSRAFSHHYSSCRGTDWMNSLISFYKLKLTNNLQDQDSHLMLHSMHRYIPRLHVIPLPEEDSPALNQSLLMGLESITFTFPQTEFMAVTTYQNFRITQLKINHNPFARGFREEGNNSRLNRIAAPLVMTELQSEDFMPAEPTEIDEEKVDQSTTEQSAAASPIVQATRLVLKPIMSNPSGTGDHYVPCIRGKHSLGELKLVQKHPADEPLEENNGSSSASTPGSTSCFRRKRRKVKRRWGIYTRPRVWKAAASSPTVAPSPSLTVAMQPELDNIEGLLFVSFTTKEALEVHVRDMPASISLCESPVSLQRPTDKTMEVNPETAEEKLSRLESLLVTDLSALRQRQVIHPVLQEVGMKLNSLDLDGPVDLKYLGVCLPPSPPSLPEQSSSSAPAPADEGLPFISRTGKTSDMTKIKGWKNKFIRSQETSASNTDGTQKNLSAFCSNMLDEYLESEAQQISERAAAFSTNPEGLVAYQLPAKGSSYVKTLDSVLRHQTAASGTRVAFNRPCPLSRKPSPYSSLRSSPRFNPKPLSPDKTQSSPSLTNPDAASGSGSSMDDRQGLLTSQPAAHKGPLGSYAQKQLMEYKSLGFNKDHFKLLLMEIRASSQGLSRNQLIPERLMMTLTMLLTKESESYRALKPPPMSKIIGGPECGQQFCRLGCVCSSLQLLDRGPVHCRKPECMFGCTCSDAPTDMDQTVQPLQSSNANKLWNRDIFDNDPEPLSVPTTASSLAPSKVPKRSLPHKAPPIREEDKDPVYKYLESMMTCARIREFNSKPPPQLSLGTDITAAISKLNDTTAAENLLKKPDGAEVTDQKAEEKPQQEKPFNETEARKQIQIHSLCQWKKDRKMVLSGLYKRLNQNMLNQRFYIGPYCVKPVTKIMLRKPSGSVVTYRVQISKPSKISDCEEEESEEEDDYICDGNAVAEEDEPMEPEGLYGVTPFLRGVMPAGYLAAKKRPAFFKGSGLIQVNGKHYNHARLLLGNIGSLHPANRLAAHLTGRLRPLSSVCQTESQKRESSSNTTAEKGLRVTAVRTNVPPAAGSTLLQPPQNPSTITQVQLLIPVLQNPQSSSMSSPVSLTVSPSLKNPSFLGQSGTYSFRICPPSTQAGGGQNPPGIALPGGFTLIELPKPGADRETPQATLLNAPDTAAAGDASAQKTDTASSLSHLAKKWVGFDTLSNVKNLLSGEVASSLSPSSGLTSGEKMPSGEISDNNQTQDSESVFDFTSEELSSDTSDYDEVEDDEEMVDIETVEEEKQGQIISAMKEDVLRKLPQTRNSQGGSRSLKDPGSLDKDFKVQMGRKNHQEIEKLRRCEQRVLFSRLQDVLRCHPKTPRDRLLSTAVNEVKKLNSTSSHLKLMKEQLIQQQSAYVKKLSLVSGKSEIMIQNKLKEIFERQKQRERNLKWKPVYSQLLETKAALVQATASKSHVQSMPSEQHNTGSPSPPIELSKSEQSNLQMLLKLLHPNQGLKNNSNQIVGNAPGQQSRLGQKITTPKTANQLGETGVLDPNPSTFDESQKASGDPDTTSDQLCSNNAPHQLAVATSEPMSKLSEPNNANSNFPFSNNLAPFPLIRSKTGRIILPSSLKPIGHGFYTLMVMDPKKKEGENEVGSSDQDPCKTLERNVSPYQPSDLDGKDITEVNAAASGSDPRSSGEITPLAKLAFLGQPVVGPLMDLQATENSQDAGVISLTANAHLCFNPQPPPPDSLESDPSPPFGAWQTGRPLKTQSPSVHLVRQEAVVEEPNIYASNMRIHQLTVQNQNHGDEKTTVEESKTRLNEVPMQISKEAPVKRGRGRPRKSNPAHPLKPAAKRAARSPSTSNDDSPVRFSISSFKSTNTSTEGDGCVSRPLTRASLGKDFPSAKKRSWIVVEKELEPDLEYA